MKRQRKGILFIGLPGHGKSLMAEKLAAVHAKREPVFWITTREPRADFAGKYKAINLQGLKNDQAPGVYVFTEEFLGDDEKITRNVYRKIFSLKNCLIIFDDAGAYENGAISKPFKRVVRMKRQNYQDHIFIYHSFADTPPAIYRFCPTVFLWKTLDDPGAASKKMIEAPKLITAYEKNRRKKFDDSKGVFYLPEVVKLF